MGTGHCPLRDMVMFLLWSRGGGSRSSDLSASNISNKEADAYPGIANKFRSYATFAIDLSHGESLLTKIVFFFQERDKETLIQ